MQHRPREERVTILAGRQSVVMFAARSLPQASLTPVAAQLALSYHVITRQYTGNRFDYTRRATNRDDTE